MSKKDGMNVEELWNKDILRAVLIYSVPLRKYEGTFCPSKEHRTAI